MLNRLILILSLLGITGQVVALDQDELLMPDEAFRFTSENSQSGLLNVQWEIADGYYLYKNKIKVTSEDGKVLKLPGLPDGKLKKDELFGDVEVYRKRVAVKVPYSSTTAVEVVYQGCADVGVCYPPQKRKVNLKLALADTSSLLPATTQSVGSSSSLSVLSQLNNTLSGVEEPDLLDPDIAFAFKASLQDTGVLKAEWMIADGYYLYKDKIKMALEAGSGLNLAEPEYPPATKLTDETFGDVDVFRGPLTLEYPIQGLGAHSGAINLKAQFQGCADIGVCYPPIKKTVTLDMPAVSPDQLLEISQVSANTSTTVVSNTEDDLSNKGVLAVLISAFFAGILLTFTPCVLPMIPILSSVIAGQGESITKAKAAWLATVYVLGTAVTYALMGAVAGATGDQLQAYFQNAWAIGILAAIFIVMSLAMFGLFEIQMPSFLQSNLQEKSQGIKGGSTPMVFVLGMVSALIVGACVSPVLISFLGLAISKGDPILGAVTMFIMALGMGIPLILLGFGAGHLLPKAGMWMDKVKYVFGVLLLGVAIYMLGILPAVPVLVLWAALFIVVGVYLGATQSLPEGANGWRMLSKGLGTLLLIWGVLSLIGSIYGERDPLKPLPSLSMGLSSASNTVTGGQAHETHAFSRVNNNAELDAKIAEAKQQGKLLLIDYYADWCVSCVKMEQTTFSDPAVLRELEARFIAVQVDVTDPNDKERKALKKRYGVFGPPALLFFDIDGQIIKSSNFYGYKKPVDFLALLKAM